MSLSRSSTRTVNRLDHSSKSLPPADLTRYDYDVRKLTRHYRLFLVVCGGLMVLFWPSTLSVIRTAIDVHTSSFILSRPIRVDDTICASVSYLFKRTCPDNSVMTSMWYNSLPYDAQEFVTRSLVIPRMIARSSIAGMISTVLMLVVDFVVVFSAVRILLLASEAASLSWLTVSVLSVIHVWMWYLVPCGLQGSNRIDARTFLLLTVSHLTAALLAAQRWLTHR